MSQEADEHGPECPSILDSKFGLWQPGIGSSKTSSRPSKFDHGRVKVLSVTEQPEGSVQPLDPCC